MCPPSRMTEPETHPPRRAVRPSAPVLVFGGLLAVYLGLYASYQPQHKTPPPLNGKYAPILARGDGHYLYMNTLSLALDRDLDLANQRRMFGAPFGGRYYPIGPSLVQMPLFLVAHAGAWVANLFGAGIPMHGYTLWHQRITFLGAVLAGFFALLLGYRLARRYVAQSAALWGTVAVGLGTALLFYSVYWSSYAHAWTALAVALLVEYWDRTRGRWDAPRWAALGAFAGLAALTRMQEVLWAALPAGEAAFELLRRVRRRDLRAALRLAVPCALATACALLASAPELVANKRVFGHWLAVYTGESYMRWSAPFFWETWFAPKNGLFIWTPLCYLGVVGLLLAPRGPARRLAAGLAAGFLLQTWVNGSAWAWWSAWSFSNRRFVGVTVALLVGVAFAIERLRGLHARWPRLAPHAALLLVLLPFLVLNLDLGRAVSVGEQSVLSQKGSAAVYEASFRRVMDGFWRHVGNPLSWPHSLIWGARHHVSPARYDDVVGRELLFFDHRGYGRKGTRQADMLRLDAQTLDRLGHGPWRPGGPEHGLDRGSGVWAGDGAALLLPLFVADHVHLIVRGGRDGPAEVRFRLNGRYEKRAVVKGTVEEVRLDPPPAVLHPGTNDLVFSCAQAPCLRVASVEAVYEIPR
jgi:hypothetical protein